jgi:NTE family protein
VGLTTCYPLTPPPSNVILWSAATASCAAPLLYPPVALLEKRSDGSVGVFWGDTAQWRDGSVAHDLPTARLSELFNVSFSVVSQANPHVLPFLGGGGDEGWVR